MPLRNIVAFALIIFVLSGPSAISQSNKIDGNLNSPALKNTISYYYSSIGENAHLYFGSEMQNRNKDGRIKGIQFFETPEMRNGSVLFDGTLYNDVPLLYDIFYDVLITNKYKQVFNIALASEKIQFFSILNDTFTRIVKDSSDRVLPGTGFYQRMYNGKTKVFIKRKKVVDEISSGQDNMETNFEQHNSYFIKKNSAYYQITTAKTLYHVFNEKGKDVRKYLRKNNISFRNDKEMALVRAAQYYDQLTN